MDQKKTKAEVPENVEKVVVGGDISSGDETILICKTTGCHYESYIWGYHVGEYFDCPRCKNANPPIFNSLYGEYYIE